MNRRTIDFPNYEGWTAEQFAQDLCTHPRYQDYFQKYEPDSVNTFIKNYSIHKEYLYKYKNYILKESEERETMFMNFATDFMDVILQKKLFNMQCLWRAGKIDLPLIEYAADFKYFESDIRNCPFLEPITEEEIELGIRFLGTIMDRTDEDFYQWQDYDAFKYFYVEEENLKIGEFLPDGCEMPPDFYRHYDKEFGTNKLAMLPDVRTAKEKLYEAAGREQARLRVEKIQEEARLNPKPPQLPSLYDRSKFVEDIEDALTKQLEKAHSTEPKVDNYTYIHDQINFLVYMKENNYKVDLYPEGDWEESIAKTVRFLKRHKAAEMLPYAYEVYQMQFEDGDWELTKYKRLKNFKYNEKNIGFSLRKMLREYIEDGKKALGVTD